MRCEEGYRCQVCGAEVAEITQSALYLRYVLGEVSLEELPHLPDCHICCAPVLAQFIRDPRFPAVSCSGPCSKEYLDADYVAAQEERVTRAWQRLQELPHLGLPLTEYPLPELRPAPRSP